ncbi:MAG TPA: acetyl/propionyl-CoA carboxylase subunit alpha, partial [Brevibacterium epidermidis]|nr:acetyl/propionyl-CoA carboxylase subunit alpha [Brevibacterium epidermidis]
TLTGPVTAAELSANRTTASAWAGPSAWRTSRPDFRPTVNLAVGGQANEVEVRTGAVDVDADGLWHVTLDGIQHTARIYSDARDRSIWVSTDSGIHVFTRPLADSSLTPGLEGAEVLAPMPGSVVDIKVETGEAVEQGDPIVVVEAMKMEHVLTAPAAGIVNVVAVAGAQVALDEVLATVVDEAAAEAAAEAAE